MPEDFQFEIVGLRKGNNGRHCEAHIAATCGESLELGDTVEVELGKLDSGEDAVKVFKIEDDIKTCHVAFLSKSFLKSPLLHLALGRAEVIEMCKDSASTYKRAIDHRFCGAALLKRV